MNNTLIIGGGKFLGFWIAKELEKLNCKVTFFNTGNNTPREFPNFKTIIGNRKSVKSRSFFEQSRFDAVIDLCAYTLEDLNFTKYLKTPHYIFVSTVAVYNPEIKRNSPESGNKITKHSRNTNNFSTYGYQKYVTECEILEIYKDSCVLRPAIILGPRDYTNRLLSYFSQIDLITLPIANDLLFQYIDVMDVARFVSNTLRREIVGTFNLCSKPIMRDSFFNEVAKVFDARIEYIQTTDFEKYPYHDKFSNENLRCLSSMHAIKNGLKLTPLMETLQVIKSDLALSSLFTEMRDSK